MREQTVVTHANAEAAGNPPQEECNEESLPRKEKESGDCTQMKQNHKRRRHPVNIIVARLFSLQIIELHCLHPFVSFSVVPPLPVLRRAIHTRSIEDAA